MSTILSLFSITIKASYKIGSPEWREEIRKGLKEMGYTDEEIDNYFKEHGWLDDHNSYTGGESDDTDDEPLAGACCLVSLGIFVLALILKKVHK